MTSDRPLQADELARLEDERWIPSLPPIFSLFLSYNWFLSTLMFYEIVVLLKYQPTYVCLCSTSSWQGEPSSIMHSQVPQPTVSRGTWLADTLILADSRHPPPSTSYPHCCHSHPGSFFFSLNSFKISFPKMLFHEQILDIVKFHILKKALKTLNL